MNFLFELWNGLTYFLFPPKCPVCGDFVDERYQFCSKCVGKVLHVDFCNEIPFQLEKVLRVTKYRDGSRDLLHKLKFDSDLSVIPSLKMILDEISDREEIFQLLDGVNFAVPVPLHENRLKERGFNQTEEIFREWLLKKNIPLKNLLARTQETQKLYSLNKFERQKVLSGVFSPTDEKIDLRGKIILIVDDIYTTGTTVSECAKVLLNLGAKNVRVLVFASDFDENLSENKKIRPESELISQNG